MAFGPFGGSGFRRVSKLEFRGFLTFRKKDVVDETGEKPGSPKKLERSLFRLLKFPSGV